MKTDPWGMIGSNEWARLSGDANRKGILRTVEGGVVYLPAPPRCVPGPAWQPTEDPYRFEMDFKLPADTEPKYQSLKGFLSGIRRLSAHDTRGETLDAAVDQLLSIVARLHQQQCGIGLVTPENVMLWTRDEKLFVMLPDLGFQRGEMPILPLWLDPDGEYAFMWDKNPEVAHRQGPNPRNDIASLARMFSYLLCGEKLKTIPPYQEGSSRHADCWNTLKLAIEGKYPTVKEFRAALKETPLSVHFLRSTSPANSRKKKTRFRVPGILQIGLLLLLVAGAAWYFIDWEQPQTLNCCPEVPKASPMYSLLKEYDEVENRPVRSVLAVKPTNSKSKKPQSPGVSSEENLKVGEAAQAGGPDATPPSESATGSDTVSVSRSRFDILIELHRTENHSQAASLRAREKACLKKLRTAHYQHLEQRFLDAYYEKAGIVWSKPKMKKELRSIAAEYSRLKALTPAEEVPLKLKITRQLERKLRQYGLRLNNIRAESTRLPIDLSKEIQE